MNDDLSPAVRARTAFPALEENSYAHEYLEAIRDNYRSVNASINRRMTILLLAMAVFELLARAMIAEASVGGFEVKDLSLIRLSLPIIVATSSTTPGI
jgi:hypothetical protein